MDENKAKRAVRNWNKFLRDVKRLQKRNYDIEKLWSVTDDLINNRPLSPLRKDHPLRGEWKDFRDCHIENDWILIYRVDPLPENERQPGGPEELVTFARTGTHSDLFD